ncbi:MAG: hypothetical protein WB952_05325 [Terriglobales bacterium]
MAIAMATPDLRVEVEHLVRLLAEAECDHQKAQASYENACSRLARGDGNDIDSAKKWVDRANALVIGIRSELGSKRSMLDKLDADEAESRARDQATEALRLADENIRTTQAELDRLQALYRQLPDEIAKARFAFSRALLARADVLRKQVVQ